MREKITQKKVIAVKPHATKDEFLWDTEAKGFGGRVKPSGARSFVLSYYAPRLHRTKRRLTIGAYGLTPCPTGRNLSSAWPARIA